MGKESLRVVVVPQDAPRRQEIRSRAPIGEQKSEELLRWFLEGSLEIPGLAESASALLDTLGTIPKPEYVLNLKGAIPEEQKKRAFDRPIAAMQKLAQLHGHKAPSRAELMSRLYIVDEETFQNLRRQELKGLVVNTDPIGVALWNRIAMVNYGAIRRVPKIFRKTALVSTGVHELWHSIAYWEMWLPDKPGDIKIQDYIAGRRVGLITNPPVVDDSSILSERLIYEGLCSLTEGFTEYLTRETLRLAGTDVRFFSPGYPHQLTLVDMLIARIGSGPFFQVSLTKEGFRTFAQALNTKYGRGALRKLAILMGMGEEDLDSGAHEEGGPPPFQSAGEFIKKGHVEGLDLLLELNK